MSDNMLWQGKVLGDAGTAEPTTRGVLELSQRLAADPDITPVLVRLRDCVTVSLRRAARG